MEVVVVVGPAIEVDLLLMLWLLFVDVDGIE